jgi:hypothetical protein
MNLRRLKKLLHYDPQTGLFTWITQRKAKAQIGTRAGSNEGRGYIVIRVDGVDYYAHRLAWFYVYGKWPKMGLDHIDHNRGHNAIFNLRESTQAQNAKNRVPGRGCRQTTSGKWQAHIRVDHKLIYLGLHATEEEAHAVYLYAKEKFHRTDSD